jgi:rhodanese-related sulfurtransferase
MTETLSSLIQAAKAGATEVPPAEASDALVRGEIQLVVDVREPHEFEEGHLPSAVNIPRGVLELRADPASPVTDAALTAQRSGRVLVYCTKGPGARSLFAAQTLASMGYDGVQALGGGLIAWEEEGLPVERAADPPPSS